LNRANPKMNMPDITSFGRYTISVLFDKKSDGIYGIAFCPICDKAEEHMTREKVGTMP